MKNIVQTKTLSLLLTLAMVLGLLPGMSLTALADGHTHDFEYSASGDTITATCKTEDCNLADNKVTLTIKAPENLYYNDTTVTHFATLENLDTFNAVTQRTYSADKIVYYKGSSQNTDIQNNKPKMATYTAKIALNPDASKTSSDFFTAGKFVSVTFAFTAKPVEHTHSFSYTANGAVITATCTSTTGTCDLTNKQATLTLNAPEHSLYGDDKNANATFTGEIPGVTNPTINYRRSDTPLSSAPEDAGTYTAWCQLGNATARVEYTINKATNPGWTTLPQAKQGLVYTGSAQELITAGATSSGDIRYGLGTTDSDANANYTGAVPSAVNAGTYYVWCKIDGGKNYTSINAQKVEVTIARADITPSVSIVGWTYGETANTPMVGDTSNPGNGTVTYIYAVKGSTEFTSTVPTAAGDYTVKATIAETANYNGGEATKDFTIAKATPAITVPTPDAVTYDPAKTLANVTLPTGWAWVDSTIVPSVSNNGYAAEFTVSDYTNYDYTNVEGYNAETHKVTRTVPLTVNNANAIAATVTANNRTYDGTEKPLVTVTGETIGGTLKIAVTTVDQEPDAEAYSFDTTSIPTATNAGTYYVWYKVAGDENHNDTNPACVEVTIAPDYAISSVTGLSGANEKQWAKGTKDGVTITVKISGEDNSFDHFIGVKLDGKDLVKDMDYTVEKGSTIVTLKPETLEKLSVGEHTVTVLFDNGEVNTTLTVLAANSQDATSPQTGDNSHMGLWIALMMFSLLGIAATLLYGRKKRVFDR